MPSIKQTPPPGGRLVGYARVSTAEQNVQMQLDALRRAGVHEDNLWFEQVSGASSKRPKLALAMADARAGDTFVVWKLDRLGRSMLDLLNKMNDFEKRQVAFRSLTEGIDTATPGGKFLLHMLAAAAQFERDMIVERTKAGVAAYRARGGRIGQPPKLSPEDVKTAMKMIADGKSVRDVAKHFSVAPGTVYNHVGKTITALRDKAKRKRKSK
jgi:DNA invertase Pin-like site-specific DNA recombinase